MSTTLDRAIRAFVEASDPAGGLVCIPGNSPQQRPPGTYATLLTLSDQRTAKPSFRQLYDADDNPSGTLTDTPRRRLYSLQFHGQDQDSDAIEAAMRFIDYTESESGLLDATTAFAGYEGAVQRIALLNFPQPDLSEDLDPDALPPLGGSFMMPPDVTIMGARATDAERGRDATAVAVLKTGAPPQPIDYIRIVNGGRGYV